jgi:hypothetical protein
VNFLALTVLSGLLSALGFYFLGGSGVVTGGAPMLLSFEAIIVAAVLVRLNRGVPSLDWKYVDTGALERLLSRLEDVAKVYIAVVLVATLSILILLAVVFIDKLTFVGKAETMLWLSTAFGGLLGVLLSRMAYVVWLDLDIVRLQKRVIISAAEAEQAKEQTKLAQDKLAAIGATRLQG